MKFSIEAKEFKELLADLILVIPTASDSRPILKQIKVTAEKEGVTFFASDLSTSLMREVKAKIAQPGCCTVPAKSLFDLVKNFTNGKNVIISLVGDDKLKVNCARARYTLSSMDPHTYPIVNFPTEDYAPMVPGAFVKAAETVSISLADEKEPRETLKNVLFEPSEEVGFMRAVATNGLKLMTCKVPGVLDTPFLLHRSAFNILKKLLDREESCGIFLTPDFLYVKLSKSFFSARLMETSKYPDYRKILPKGKYVSVILDRKALLESLKRALIFSDKIGNKVSLSVSMTNTLTIKANNVEGEAEEEVMCSSKSKITSNMEVGFNGKFLEQVISRFGKEEIEWRIYSTLSPSAFLDGSNIMGIVMPMRL